MDKIAKEIIAQIDNAAKNTDGKIANIEKQVEDLKKAQRLIQESSYRTEISVSGNEDELKSFINDDGSVRWKSGKTVVATKNGNRQVVEKGLLDSETACSQWHADLIEMHTTKSMARLLLRGGETPKLDLSIERHLQKAPRSIKAGIEKAMYDGSGFGAEFVPDEFRAELYQEYQVPRVVRGLFQELPMQNNTLLVPRVTGGRPYLKGQVTSDMPAAYQASNIGAAQKQVSVAGFASHFVIDDALVEDSAVALVPALQQLIAQDIADSIEDCIINGDNAAVHQDDLANWNIRSRWGASGLGGSSDHRRGFIGLRAAAFDRSSTLDFSGTLTAAKILNLASKMGELAISDRVLIVSPEALISHIMPLAEVLTIDKFGPAASILSGQVASIFGMPIVVSRFMSADMNASGLFDNVTTSKTGILMASRNSWKVFSKRGIVVEQDKEIQAGAIHLVATERMTFNTLDADTTKNVAFGFNL